MGGIMNADAILLRLDLTVQIAGNALEFGDHDLDLRNPAALLVNLKPFQANKRLT